MAPAAATNVTAITEASIVLTSMVNHAYNATNITYNNNTSTTPVSWDYGDTSSNITIWTPTPGYVYFYSGYAFYVVLVFLFIFVLPLVVIMSAMQRKRQANARNLVLQRQRARRQMEVSVCNNSTINGNTSGTCNVNVEAENDMSILPKGMDLPPSYEELAYNNNMKQPGSVGASMLTIDTTLECSNPNLAATLEEPPPDYEQGATATTTTTTTTTVIVNGALPRI